MNIATHELKTPLVSIIDLSEVMKNNSKKIPSKYQEYISIINFEDQKLNHLIKKILSVTRNEHGEIELNLKNIDVREMISSLKPLLKMLTKRSESKIEIKNNFKAEGKDNLKIEVIDERERISKDLQEKIFTKFSQLEPSLTRSQGGMDPGLYISKQNVEALGGKIGFEYKKK